MQQRRIVVIGDESNRHIKGIEHYSLAALSQRFEKFKGVYEHLSSMPEWFELICFQRWFATAELMEQLGLDEAWINDSDNLLFSRYEEAKPSVPYDYAICIKSNESATGAISFWTVAALIDFCNFIQHTYAAQLIRLENIYEANKSSKNKGGVCDMTLLQLFIKEKTQWENVNVLKIINNSCVDAMINSSFNAPQDEFVMTNKLKKLIRNDNHYYGFLKRESLNPIKFHSLQFQGGSKKYIHRYCTYPINLLFKAKREVVLRVNIVAVAISKLINTFQL